MRIKQLRAQFCGLSRYRGQPPFGELKLLHQSGLWFAKKCAKKRFKTMLSLHPTNRPESCVVYRQRTRV